MNCLFKAKVHLVQKKRSPLPFERLFLVETSSFFSAHFLCNLKMNKYFNCEYIYIYIFVPGDLLQKYSWEICVRQSWWSWWQYFQLVSSFILIFCCKFYENLFAVWRKEKNMVQKWHGNGVESSACFSCLFITQQMYEK